jgi:capsular exopolysaccharide synthesis family protein
MSSPAYPAQYGPAPPQAAGGLPQVSVHTVLVALRCWWHIALPTGLLLAAGAATVVFYITKPTYTAEAWIEIARRPMAIIPGSAGDDSQRFVANQTQIMRSPPVLEPVIGLPAVRSAPELRDEEDPVSYLRNNLQIRAQGDSDFFVIAFASEDPSKAALIVNEVVDSYFKLYQRHDSRVAELQIDILTRQAEEQFGEVQRLRERVDVLTKQLTAEGTAPAGDTQDKQRADTMQQQLERQLLTAEIERATTAAEHSAEEKLFLQEEFTPPDELVAPRVAQDPQLSRLKAELTIKKEKREEHKKVSKNLAANFLYQQLEKEIAADEAEIERLAKEIAAEVKADLTQSGRLKRQAQIEQLRVQLMKLDEVIAFLKDRTKKESVEQQQVAGKALELEFARADLKRAAAFHDALASRIQLLKAERRAPERVNIYQSATTPTRPDEEIPLKKMLMAAMAALLVPFGLAVGIELLFGRVASRQQLEHAGKIAVVGEITNLPRRIKGQAAGGLPRRDVQLFEESINGLRTYLTLIEASRGRRVLAVTSSISREGKTSLAAQLAVSVANSTGKPTLLIDGDMRSPDVHRIFDVDVGPGLAEVLAGSVPVEEAIETEVSSQLHLLTAGRMKTSPHQLTGGGEFAATIEKLRGMYENIIIDTPPILPASEALLMAGAADATILCVRRDFSRVDQVSESVKRLAASGVKVAGAVLNGVPTQHYAYRYGSYYYTKGRDTTAAEPADDALTAS